MSSKRFTPYVPAETDLPEFTLKAIVLGILMAVVLGAANAYLGLKAGLTISATFPAAVVAIAAFRLPFLRGNVLEQNIARTAASVGEALVAGAIFTIPAFLIARVDGQPVWAEFDYWSSTWIMLVGGVLGVLFVILLRRTLVEDADLPFPESAACAELVKAGQKGESGARYRLRGDRRERPTRVVQELAGHRADRLYEGVVPAVPPLAGHPWQRRRADGRGGSSRRRLSSQLRPPRLR